MCMASFQLFRMSLCPVTARLEYLQTHGAEEGSLFQLSSSQALTTWRYFLVNLRKALAQAGFNGTHHAGHRFCVGTPQQHLRQGFQMQKLRC